jgi:hypothetical protein
MKKVLRFLLILIVILFVGYLILCIATPAQMTVVKSTTINAPKNVVWNQMVDLENQQNWSPWKEMDPSIKTTITGPAGEVGQKSAWTSEDNVGDMTISTVAGDSMRYDLHFVKPFEGKAVGWVTVSGEDGAVVATNGYSGESGFWMRGLSALFGKRMMEKTLERGLELLKDYVESGKAEVPAPAYVIEEYTFPATSFAIIRKTVKMNEMDSFFHQSYRTIETAAGSQIKGNKHTIAYTWDEAKGEADLAVGFPVNGPVKGVTMLDIPESKGYKLVMTGAYNMESFKNAHTAIGKHAGANGLTDPLMMEEYVTGPEQEADTNKWVTHLYYIAK